MSEAEILLQYIVECDGQAVRNLLINMPFERQLQLARKAQSLNLTQRKTASDIVRVYAHFDLLGNSQKEEVQERLTIRVIANGVKADVYTVQRRLNSARLTVRFIAAGNGELQPESALTALSHVEIQVSALATA